MTKTQLTEEQYGKLTRALEAMRSMTTRDRLMTQPILDGLFITTVVDGWTYVYLTQWLAAIQRVRVDGLTREDISRMIYELTDERCVPA